MPSTGGRKFGRKGAQGPDTLDINTLLQAFWDEWRIAPWYVISQALDGNVMVECNASYTDVMSIRHDPSCVRVVNPNVENLLHIMLQLGHVLWHQIDRGPTVHVDKTVDG